MDSLLNWGTSFILWAQSFRNPFLDGLFTFFTLLGEEEFYLVFLPLIYWCFSRAVGLSLGIVFLLSDYLNGLLKDLFATPRPTDPRIVVLREETSPGFPSGHAQNAVVLWGYVASQLHNPLTWALAVILPLAIGFSRVYLGVHFPHDVLGGWLIGAVFLLLALVGVNVAKQMYVRPSITLLVAIIAPLALLAVTYSDAALRDMAVLMGLGLGALGERHWVRFDVRGNVARQVGKLAIGLIVLLVLWLGLKVVLPVGPAFRFLRYASLGLWVALGGPWLFVQLGLAQQE